MKNRFRFRAWNKAEKQMYYDVERTYDYMFGKPIAVPAKSFGELLEDNNYIVEQCTGLSDKNGKLIYEGDFVQYLGDGEILYQGIVEWCCGDGTFCGGWRAVEYRNNVLGLSKHCYLFYNKWEVIGNIHEMELGKE